MPLPDTVFDIILADPPWDYDNRVQHGGSEVGYTSGALAFYPTMKPAELEAMGEEVKSRAAKNSLLYMWTTGPQMSIAIDVMESWGFKYKTVAFVWDKERVNPGAYTMSQTEFVLVGKRGSIPKPRGVRNARQLHSEPRTKHSKKPEEIQDRLDAMHPTQSKLEMFARRERPGWTCWGNEVTDD